jgi:hypothetical protein
MKCPFILLILREVGLRPFDAPVLEYTITETLIFIIIIVQKQIHSLSYNNHAELFVYRVHYVQFSNAQLQQPQQQRRRPRIILSSVFYTSALGLIYNWAESYYQHF